MNIKEAIKEIRQSRSRYQLEKFVIGQHDTPEMQYYQCCLEASSLVNALKEQELRIKKIKAEIEELLETGKKSDAIEAEIKRMDIENIELGMIGTRRELDILEDIFSKFPKYTREQIEEAQEDYWSKRLIRVGQMQMLAASSGVNWAQLDAIYQAGLMPTAREQLGQVDQLEEHKAEILYAIPVKEKEAA